MNMQEGPEVDRSRSIDQVCEDARPPADPDGDWQLCRGKYRTVSEPRPTNVKLRNSSRFRREDGRCVECVTFSC
jgi:hypothetical protein